MFFDGQLKDIYIHHFISLIAIDVRHVLIIEVPAGTALNRTIGKIVNAR
jgi:hypothetical protein